MRTPSTTHAVPPATLGLPAKVIEWADEFTRPHREILDRVLAHVAQEHGVTIAELLKPGKSRRVVVAKREAANLAVRALCPPLSREVVATWLNIGRASLYRLLADDRQNYYDGVAARLGFKPLAEDKPNG